MMRMVSMVLILQRVRWLLFGQMGMWGGGVVRLNEVVRVEDYLKGCIRTMRYKH